MDFENLKLDKGILKHCKKIGFKKPTLVQEKTIPLIMNKENVIIKSQTGSGKTMCFGFPILQNIYNDPYGIIALIIAPSRELAYQIEEQFILHGSQNNLRTACLTGGVNILSQHKKLDDIPHIVIGTPGRLKEMLNTNEVFKKYIVNLKYLILDEVDMWFNDTLYYHLKNIKNIIPTNISYILTSATFDEDPLDLEKTKEFIGENYKLISLNDMKKISEKILQKYVWVPKYQKIYYLFYILNLYKDSNIIIFVKNCKKCEIIYKLLKKLKFNCTNIHGYLNQQKRFNHLNKFKNLKSNILIATDVASRGLDIRTVEFVINYNIPQDYRTYIHRIGRTSRGNDVGWSLTMVSTKYDVKNILNIEENINEKLELFKDIDEEKILENMNYLDKKKRIVKQEFEDKGKEEEFKIKKKNKLKFLKKIKNN